MQLLALSLTPQCPRRFRSPSKTVHVREMKLFVVEALSDTKNEIVEKEDDEICLIAQVLMRKYSRLQDCSSH